MALYNFNLTFKNIFNSQKIPDGVIVNFFRTLADIGTNTIAASYETLNGKITTADTDGILASTSYYFTMVGVNVPVGTFTYTTPASSVSSLQTVPVAYANKGILDSLRPLLLIVNGDVWMTVNAYDDGSGKTNGTNWYADDDSKPSFGLQINFTNNIQFETNTRGYNIWTRAKGYTSPFNAFATFGGWNLGFLFTEFKDMVVGGYGIEVDGNGLAPYGRFLNTRIGGKQFIGVLNNAYADVSNTDYNTLPSWAMGINATDDKIIFSHAPAGAGVPAFSNVFTIDNKGTLYPSGGTVGIISRAGIPTDVLPAGSLSISADGHWYKSTGGGSWTLVT